MKATPTILAAVLTLSMNVLFASNDGAAMNSEVNTINYSLAPCTPYEATFEEVNEESAIGAILSPSTPTEADFSDAVPEITIDMEQLAPVTPTEADFNSEDENTNAVAFAPVTPSVADFSDGI